MELVGENGFLLRFGFVGFFPFLKLKSGFLFIYLLFCRDLWSNGISREIYLFNIWD